MKITSLNLKQRQAGTIIVYFLAIIVLAIAIVSACVFVTGTSKLTRRRSDMNAAIQYAEGGAVLACYDLNRALTNSSGTFPAALTSLSPSYTAGSGSSTQRVYTRTISSPFTSNQTVTAEIWLPNVSSPTTAKVIATATVGEVTQTATVNVRMGWGYPAAIISVNDGSSDTAVAKSSGQAGNVVMNGSSQGPIVIDGGPGMAVLANGRFNYDTNAVTQSSGAYSTTNYGTANEIPDYTSQGNSNALFDINRFIAVANATTNGYSPTRNNHFTNLLTFMTAVNAHTNSNPMQGVVAVDVWDTDKNLSNLTDKNLPGGINVRGTLLYNFLGTGWDKTSEKMIVTADININPADLSHLVATNPATYTTGYPPTYTDLGKNPVNINIAPSYQNFTISDYLPALLYTFGCLDMHGNANISGVCYTPSYMEIENKQSSQTQYIRGSLIMGNGIYYENQNKSTSIISFDPNTVDSLATLNSVGKQVKVSYWK